MTQQRDHVEEAFINECYKEKETPTYYMAEIYEHILFHGDGEWDFKEGGVDYMSPEELTQVNWELLRKFTQLHKGEEAEELEGTAEARKKAMIHCINFIKATYNDDLGLPNPEQLQWETTGEHDWEVSNSQNFS